MRATGEPNLRLTVGVALGLSWVAGFVDTGGYLSLIRVFTANMTGNTIALGIAIAGGGWSQAFVVVVNVARREPLPIGDQGVLPSEFDLRRT